MFNLLSSVLATIFSTINLFLKFCMVQIWRSLSRLLLPSFSFFYCSLSEILHPSSWLISVLKNRIIFCHVVYRPVQISKDTVQAQNKALAPSFFLFFPWCFVVVFCFCFFLTWYLLWVLMDLPLSPNKAWSGDSSCSRVCFSTVEEPNAFFHGLQLSTWKQKADLVLHHSFVVPSPACWLKRLCFLLSASFLGSSKRWYMRRAFRLESDITSRPEESCIRYVDFKEVASSVSRWV